MPISIIFRLILRSFGLFTFLRCEAPKRRTRNSNYRKNSFSGLSEFPWRRVFPSRAFGVGKIDADMSHGNLKKTCIPTDDFHQKFDSIKNAYKSNTSDNMENKGQFDVYGCQITNQHPFYRTTNKEYGWFPPDENTVSTVYYPTKHNFSNYLAAAGMYRNHSLNTSLDPPEYK